MLDVSFFGWVIFLHFSVSVLIFPFFQARIVFEPWGLFSACACRVADCCPFQVSVRCRRAHTRPLRSEHSVSRAAYPLRGEILTPALAMRGQDEFDAAPRAATSFVDPTISRNAGMSEGAASIAKDLTRSARPPLNVRNP